MMEMLNIVWSIFYNNYFGLTKSMKKFHLDSKYANYLTCDEKQDTPYKFLPKVKID